MLTGWFGSTEAGSRASGSDSGSRSDPDDDTQIMEPDQGNVLSHIISQLRPGADLSRVVLPTFILEPRSMLERITNFMCHPEMLLHIPTIDDDVERFVSVVKFYLSGWHIRPPGVKKPLNPILGEVFSCYWDLPDNKKAYYISEQTSHHPPKSSYFYMAPDHHIRIDGTLKPRSKFLGNSAASMMEGIAFLSLLNRGKDKTKGERYIVTQPNMYARGILFGKMKYELGDHSFVRCPELDLTADLDFKTKGWVSGTYNAVGGVIKRESTGEVLYEISGMWHEKMSIKNLATGQSEMFFDATHAKPSNPQTRPIPEQEERESQRLWELTAKAVKERNHEVATDEKTKIEDRQRAEAAARAQENKEWQPRLFRAVKPSAEESEQGEESLEWIIDAHIDSSASPDEQTKQVLSIFPVLPGQNAGKVPAAPSNDAAHAAPSPTAAKPAASGNDLIDIGNDASAAPPVKPADDVGAMLKETGKPGEGSLIDL
ncbi:Oxysterol-binding protein [Cordyceps fumosorosea ARSEF 2679]|uniref:Oxysterol-binding protein n=1 Tax=Cordyceps fumosorosea (strain ARSEF 2679) TaxID=1081104 RepID=A0A167ZHP2_CORFA|nr:Oxysterol-binding protein [Cordyceps fumosorosea ARSEF 2679]OAA67530.1 Oxysterol-binding protein [Cordyceps fumosorosea ARSEF 2679]